MSESRFHAVSLNLRGDLTAAEVTADVTKAAAAGDLIGWQEVLHPRDRQAIRALHEHGWNSFFPWTATGLPIELPISWHALRWEQIAHGHRFMHGGLAHVSPARYASYVVLRNKTTRNTIARVNTHIVNKAWGPWIPTRPWRRSHWLLHRTRLLELCHDLRAQGHIVIVGGDFNRDEYRVLGDGFGYDVDWDEPTHGDSLYDYLMHAPRGGRLALVGAHVARGFHSDHDAQVAAYSLRDG